MTRTRTLSDVLETYASSRPNPPPPTPRSRNNPTTSSSDPSPTKRARTSEAPSLPVMPPRVALLRSLALPPHDDADSWNPNDKSSNLYLRRNGKTAEDRLWVRRNNVARSTDAVRGKVAYSSGVHLFEFTWDRRHRGTHAVVGVATKHAPLHCDGYKALVGSNPESYGWELRTNRLLHNTKLVDDDDVADVWGGGGGEGGLGGPGGEGSSGSDGASEDVDNNARDGRSRPPPQPPRTYEVSVEEAPDTFEAVLDFDEGTLAFIIDGVYQGVAFRDLKGQELYPVVSCVWGHCEIRLRYMASLPALPSTLFDYSLKTIQENIKSVDDMALLPLPKHVITHLKETYRKKSPASSQA